MGNSEPAEMLQITLVLTEGFSDWEIAPMSGLGRAFYGVESCFVSPDGGPLASIAGLKLSDTERFETPAKSIVVVCGGPVFESSVPPDLDDRLCNALDKGCIIAGICGGTIALARAGLLNSVNHTSNGPGYLGGFASDYSGEKKYVDQPVALRDGNIITAAASAPASFAFEILTAAGVDVGAARQMMNMLAREHLHP